MSQTSSTPSLKPSPLHPDPGSGRNRNLSLGVFLLVLVVGAAYVGVHLVADLSVVHEASVLPYFLLAVALLIALGFEFVNGFHDTANAVATVIYTHSLSPNFAVIWSGTWNFLGVLVSSGAVAFGILQLLPIELILGVGSSAGFAMVFALLIAAIIWNLLTWYFGLPSSSSHTLIGSIIGVGLMNQMLVGTSGTSGVDWNQAIGVGKSLLFSPLIGFLLAGLVLTVLKATVRIPALYKEPKDGQAPPGWIRGLLILTCTGVSFAHGSNDGQKGMGLIMLILIGTVPTAYALNKAMTPAMTPVFIEASHQASGIFARYETPTLSAGQTTAQTAPQATPQTNAPSDTQGTNAREQVQRFVQSHQFQPATLSAMHALTDQIAQEVGTDGSIAGVPVDRADNVRNNMYVMSEAIRLMAKSDPLHMSDADHKVIGHYKSMLDNATKFIPTWVKVAVALALGLGTMVGWKRIVVTVGEKIGKQHLTYGQGASAEAVAMVMIGAADMYGLPVSTTHVLSSGVAGTMVANGSGLQWSTVRSLLMAWILTLPASIALAAVLYWIFHAVF